MQIQISIAEEMGVVTFIVDDDQHRAESSLVLFDKDGKVMWEAP